MANAQDFVELGRTFHDLRVEGQTDDDGELRASLFGRETVGWKDIREESRTILLAEAGAGKTAEIRAMASRLRTEGRAAFFLRIEHVANHLEDAFEVGDHAKFQDWLSSDEPGWLLLDSVDEARLHSPKDFELAVRRLGPLPPPNEWMSAFCGRRPKADGPLPTRDYGAPARRTPCKG